MQFRHISTGGVSHIAAFIGDEQRLASAEKKTIRQLCRFKGGMQSIEKRMDRSVHVIYDRSESYRSMYERFARKTVLSLLLYARLPNEKAGSLLRKMKEGLQHDSRLTPLQGEIAHAETYAANGKSQASMSGK